MVFCFSCDSIPLKFKRKRAGLQFTRTDYLSLLLTPLRIRWTIPLIPLGYSKYSRDSAARAATHAWTTPTHSGRTATGSASGRVSVLHLNSCVYHCALIVWTRLTPQPIHALYASHTCSCNLYIFSLKKITHLGALLHALILCLRLNDSSSFPAILCSKACLQ
jgi:hypothetical protein